MLTLIKELPDRTKKGEKIGIFRCDCGKTRKAPITDVNRGHIKSCGCSKFTAKGSLITRKSYRAMIARCYNKNSTYYNKYGGKGILVCSRWLESIENFIEDLGERPGLEYSIDRIDNELGYEPDNCKWATRQEQAEGRSSTRKITFNGKTQSISAWERELGLPRGTLHRRLKNMTIEDAVKLPIKNSNRYSSIK